MRNIINETKISIPIDHDKVNDIAERLLNENVDLKVKVIESKNDVITVIDKSKEEILMDYTLVDKIREEKTKENKVTYLTRKALFKLYKDEVEGLVEDIKDGWWFDPEPNEIYVTNEQILEYAKNNFGIE